MKKPPMIIAERNAELDAAWKLFEWNGSVRLTAKRGDFDITGGVLKSREALQRAVHNLEEGGWSIYVGANPARGTRTKASAREVEVWRFVVVDLDPFEPECAPELAIEQVLAEGSRLVGGLQDAATVAFTGRGAQAWVAVDPHLLLSMEDRSTIERGMGAFLHQLRVLWQDKLGYRVDTSTSDLARIVRLPGSINRKTGERARIIRLAEPYGDEHTSTDSQHRPVVRAEAILELSGPAPPAPEPAEGIDLTNLNKLAPHLNNRARRFLRMGEQEGERHKSAFAAAKNLWELGVDLAVARTWMYRGGRKCYPKKLSHSECDHALRQAWKER